MKLISKAAMATALALGSIALPGAPVIAAKKEKPPKPPEMKLGKEVRAALSAAQAANAAGDFATSKAKLAEADGFAKEAEERYWISQVRLETGTKANDPAIQAEGVKGALASGLVPAADLPRFSFFAGKFAYDAKDYAGAKAKLAEAERLGYKGSDLYLLLADSNLRTGAVPAGLAYLETAIASERTAGKVAPESWYAIGLSAAYKAKMSAESIKWSINLVSAYPTQSNWRDAFTIFRQSTQLDVQSDLDLMRLMRVTKTLAGQSDYHEYAESALQRALYGEAKSVIDEGRAQGMLDKATTGLNETYAAAVAKIPGDKNSLVGAEKDAAASTNYKVALGSADAFLGYGENDKAVTLYRIALSKGAPDRDVVNSRIGIALARSGDLAGARQAFESVTSTGPRGQLAKFWLLYISQSGAPSAPAAPGH